MATKQTGLVKSRCTLSPVIRVDILVTLLFTQYYLPVFLPFMEICCLSLLHVVFLRSSYFSFSATQTHWVLYGQASRAISIR